MARTVLPTSSLTIDVARFEEWNEPAAAFDLAICAQAYHWVDPEIAGPKIARALKNDARFACFWNAVEARVSWLDEAYAQHAPELGYHGAWTSIDEWIEQHRAYVQRGGALEVGQVRRYPWTMRKSADAYVRLLDTYSEHATLPEATRAALYPAIRAAIDARGGVIERNIVAYLLLARRRTVL
jgi:SAM-dependent methyltransferase